MEYFLKRRVFQGGTVYIAGNPVVIEDWRALKQKKQISNDKERRERGAKVDIPVLRDTCNLLRT